MLRGRNPVLTLCWLWHRCTDALRIRLHDAQASPAIPHGMVQRSRDDGPDGAVWHRLPFVTRLRGRRGYGVLPVGAAGQLWHRPEQNHAQHVHGPCPRPAGPVERQHGRVCIRPVQSDLAYAPLYVVWVKYIDLVSLVAGCSQATHSPGTTATHRGSWAPVSTPASRNPSASASH